MPELPEVETIRRDLEPLIRGREIIDFCVAPGASRLLRGVPADAVSAQLRGRRFDSIQRRGKYLGMSLDDGACCVVHLRMTGSLRFREPTQSPTGSHARHSCSPAATSCASSTCASSAPSTLSIRWPTPSRSSAPSRSATIST